MKRKLLIRKSEKEKREKNWKKEFNNDIDLAFDYIKESRRYIYFVIFVFVISAFLGFIFSEHLGFLNKLLRELVEQTSGLNPIELINFIFINNLTSAFLGLFLGVFLGIFSLLNGMINGSVLGYVFAKVYGISGASEFWRILPHGIFELPAIFISLGLGLKLGLFMFSKNPKQRFKYRLYNSMRSFFYIVMPLLVIAAIIEGILIAIFK